MRRAFLPLLILAGLGACQDEPENIQTKADNLSRSLENKADALEAEASNNVDAAVAPLDNQANALLAPPVDLAENAGNIAENSAR